MAQGRSPQVRVAGPRQAYSMWFWHSAQVLHHAATLLVKKNPRGVHDPIEHRRLGGTTLHPWNPTSDRHDLNCNRYFRSWPRQLMHFRLWAWRPFGLVAR